jgi:hypothetical protein
VSDDVSRHIQHVTDCARAREEAETDFIEAVLHAARSGASQRQIGNACGLSHARIGQIVRKYEYLHRY